jgi:hypothetical protein
VPGVVSTAGLGTVFTCTNGLNSTVLVGVEVFGPAGGAALNDASATSLAVDPGETVVFSTSAMNAFEVDSNLVRGVTKGVARVLTTTSFKASQSILCSAILAESANHPPTVMTTLPVIRR